MALDLALVSFLGGNGMRDIRLYNPSTHSRLSDYATKLMRHPHWVLTQDFVHSLSGDLRDFYIHIPQGYLFKKWQIPPMLTYLIGPQGEAALIVLTYLREHRTMRYKEKVINLSIDMMERVFMDLLKRLGVSILKRATIKTLLPFYRVDTPDKGYRIKKQAISFYLKETFIMRGYYH